MGNSITFPEKRTGAGGVICAGNWIVDIVHSIDHWPAKNDLARIGLATMGVGGGAANVLTNLAEFDPNLPLLPTGCLGVDDYGSFIMRHCDGLNVDTQYLLQLPNVATAHTHVMNVVGESRTFFYAGGANDLFSIEHMQIEKLKQTGHRLFYLGYIMLLAKFDQLHPDGSTIAAKALKTAREAGLITCVDLVSAAHADFAKIVSASLPHIDYLILNETEASRALELDIPDRDLSRFMSEAGRRFLEAGVNKAVVIHTPSIALWADNDGQELWSSATPIPEAEINSPVGAGDAFCSGLLFAIHEGFAAEKAMWLGHKLAAANLAVATANGGIPNKTELL